MRPGAVAIDQSGFLVWRLQSNDHTLPQWYRPSPRVLNDFIRLHAEPDQSILDYARRSGVLLLDEYGQPAENWKEEGSESLHDWRVYSLKAHALLNVATAIKNRKLGTEEDWQIIDPAIDPDFPAHHELSNEALKKRGLRGKELELVTKYALKGIAAARLALQRAIGVWCHLGRTTLTVELDGTSWRTAIDYHGRLFSAIALQLLLTVANADSLYVCSGCSYPYSRSREKRVPRPGQRNFCEECDKFGMPLKFADRDRREREARRTYKPARST